MPRRTREQWRQIVANYKASGFRAIDFAQREGLNANTFSWWRHELRQECRREQHLTLVSVPSPTATALAEPVPPTATALVAEPVPVVIHFPNGTEVQVPQGVETGWMRRLLKALQ